MSQPSRTDDSGSLFGQAQDVWILDLHSDPGAASPGLVRLLELTDPDLSWDSFSERFGASDRACLELAWPLWKAGQPCRLEQLSLVGSRWDLVKLPGEPLRLQLTRAAQAYELPLSYRRVFGELPGFCVLLLTPQLLLLDAVGPELSELSPRGRTFLEWGEVLSLETQRQMERAAAEVRPGAPALLEFWAGPQFYQLCLTAPEAQPESPLVAIWQNCTLRKSLSMLESSLGAAAVRGGWELDCQTQQLVWTAETHRVFGTVLRPGVQPEAPPLSDWLLTFQGRSRNEFEEAVLGCIQEGEPFDLELDCLRPDRTRCTLRVLGRALWKAGMVARLVGACQDISERRQQEEKLRMDDGRAQALLSVWPDAYLVLDYDGDIKSIHLPEGFTVAGLGSDAVGRSIKVVLPSLHQFFNSGVQTLFKGGRARMHEFTFPDLDGNERRLEARVLIFDGGGGRPVRYALLLKDLTPSWARELELIAARDVAVEASKIKSQFLANMSHEIRTPLNGVLGMTELVLGTELNTEQRECLDAALQSGRSLLQIVDDILDLSKIEADKLELELIPFSVRQVARECLNGVAVRAQSKQLELLARVDSEIPSLVVGDPVRFKQILNNLLSNAVKFTERGEVELEITQREPDWVRVNVFDSGLGIPPDQQGQIFEAFIQADGTTTRKFGGTGLGLAICKQLVEKMEGQIWLESQSGQGSRFSLVVRLPAYQSLQEVGPLANLKRDLGPKAALVTPELAEAVRELRILVVDDNAASRRVLKSMLGAWAVQAVTAPDLENALVQLREAARRRRPIQLLLLDLPEDPAALSVLTGLDAGTATVLMSTLGRAVPSESDQARIAAVLTKPIQANDLAEILVKSAASGYAQTPITLDAPAEAVALSIDGTGVRVLLAEDNQINAKVVTRILEGLGFSVTHVGNGQLALDELERNHYDLALMDVQMPVLDGLEATRRWRQREKASGTHLIVIALTANAMMGDRERCLEYGMDHYLTKPIHRDRLIEVLHEVGARQLPLQASIAP